MHYYRILVGFLKGVYFQARAVKEKASVQVRIKAFVYKDMHSKTFSAPAWEIPGDPGVEFKEGKV